MPRPLASVYATLVSPVRFAKVPPRLVSVSPSVVTVPPMFVTVSPRFVTVSPMLVTVSPRLVTVSPMLVTVSPRFVTVLPRLFTVSPMVVTLSPTRCTSWFVSCSCEPFTASVLAADTAPRARLVSLVPPVAPPSVDAGPAKVTRPFGSPSLPS